MTEAFVSTLCIFLVVEGSGLDVGWFPLPIAATNKSGWGHVSPCMYGGDMEEAGLDAHSESKSLLIQNDITQAPFLYAVIGPLVL